MDLIKLTPTTQRVVVKATPQQLEVDGSAELLVLKTSPTHVVSRDEVSVVEVEARGLQGTKGDPGPPGAGADVDWALVIAYATAL